MVQSFGKLHLSPPWTEPNADPPTNVAAGNDHVQKVGTSENIKLFRCLQLCFKFTFRWRLSHIFISSSAQDVLTLKHQ
jgi:hypothetical protein